MSKPQGSLWLCISVLLCCLIVNAQGAELYAEADHTLGKSLMVQNKCAACHISRVGGDGSAIYRPQGRIRTPAALTAMVERCSTELSLSLFPDEVNAIAAVLNRDYYKFK